MLRMDNILFLLIIFFVRENLIPILRVLHAGPCFVMGSCSRYQSPTTIYNNVLSTAVSSAQQSVDTCMRTLELDVYFFFYFSFFSLWGTNGVAGFYNYTLLYKKYL